MEHLLEKRRGDKEMNNFHFRKIKQLKDWERDLSAVLVFKNDMDEETRNDTIRYRDLLVYAIEQIERVRELEDKLARIRFVNNDYDKINKRYREYLELIRITGTHGKDIKTGEIIRSDEANLADEALEGESE